MNNSTNANGDFEVPQVQPDGISSISFSPSADNFFVASSWNNEVRFWQAMSTGQSMPKAMTSGGEAVLCTTWGKDNTSVFFGGCDKTVQMWAPQTNQKQQVGVHDAPVKNVQFVQDLNMLVSSSWDRSLRWWDVRSPSATPKAQIALSERAYDMDVQFPLLCVAVAPKSIVVFDLRKPQTPYKTIESTLREQTRSIKCFPDKTGFACASIEGRVSIQHVETKEEKNNFAFRCHRTEKQIFPVNVLAFHPVHGTFATCGGDGIVNFWDRFAKQRLKLFNTVGMPISAASFNTAGNIFAYAASYEWSKGAQFYNKAEQPRIWLHAVQDGDVKPRKKVPRR